MIHTYETDLEQWITDFCVHKKFIDKIRGNYTLEIHPVFKYFKLKCPDGNFFYCAFEALRENDTFFRHIGSSLLYTWLLREVISVESEENRWKKYGESKDNPKTLNVEISLEFEKKPNTPRFSSRVR